MKIGLLGGSFNPIHNGHLAIAETVKKKLRLDKIWFLPSGKHPFKRNNEFLPPSLRYQLVQTAIKNYSDFEVHDFDFHHSGGYSYTDELIKRIKNKFPEDIFYFIIGADLVPELSKWHNFQWLLKNVKFVVVNRPDADKSKFIDLDYVSRLRFVKMKPVDISSTDIRDRLFFGNSISGLVPPEVEKKLLAFMETEQER